MRALSYLVLARKYRPQRFEDVVGQEAIATTLRNAIDRDRIAHAYLFVGQRGVGKTTMARIFAKALNCEKGPTGEPCGKCAACTRITAGDDVDVVEIDGASNRNIDDVRDIRENARYSASHSRFKIYYIDEVHQLTPQAFNALLKTLEEPPPHVKFIFATTEAHKIPGTILSRCQRFDFRPISIARIEEHLKSLCKREKVKIEKEALCVIARRAGGSMRDAQTLLDQLISFAAGKIALEDVYEVVGAVGPQTIDTLVEALANEDAAGALAVIDRVLSEGKDVGEFLGAFTEALRDLLVAKSGGVSDGLREGLSPAADWSLETILYMMNAVTALQREIRRGNRDRAVIEMVLVKLARLGNLAPVGELVARIEALQSGRGVARSTGPSPRRVPGAARKRDVAARGDVSADWKGVLDAVKGRSRSLFGKLSVAQVDRVDENGITLICKPWLQGLIREGTSHEILVECMREVLGKELRIDFTEDAGANTSSAAPSAEASTGTTREVHEAVDRASRIIPGHIISQKDG